MYRCVVTNDLYTLTEHLFCLVEETETPKNLWVVRGWSYKESDLEKDQAYKRIAGEQMGPRIWHETEQMSK